MRQQEGQRSLEKVDKNHSLALNKNLHLKIFFALALAIPSGLFIKSPVFLALLGLTGTLFLNALKLLIVPIILSSIISGILNLPDVRGLGRIGTATIIYYLSTSILAVATGCIVLFAIKPGISNALPTGEILGFSHDTFVNTKLVSGSISDLKDIFIRMVPPNIVSAAAKGQMLGLIFFGLLFGISCHLTSKKGKETLTNLVNALFEATMKMTELVMLFAPVGIFALVAKVFAQTGLHALRPLALFFFTVFLALSIHFFLTLPVILRFFGISPIRHMKSMTPALLTALSTASSSATLPVTMECVEKNAGIPNRVSSFVLPLGATVNMDGTALYECVAALFIAQAMGVKITIIKAFVVAFTAVITSIGVAGIPAASLVAIAIILKIMGLPAETMGPILAVDRILDMLRTSVNVFSDSCGAAVVARVDEKDG